jgi:hypothetical protein
MRNHVEENENNSLTNPGKNYHQKSKDAELSNLLNSYWQPVACTIKYFDDRKWTS